MGADDEMAVVSYKGKWYTKQVWGGNWQYAVTDHRSFTSMADALVAASDSNTEYGIRVYKNEFDVDGNEFLEKYYGTTQNKFWEADLKESNARKEELKLALASHHVDLRNDSTICRAYISGGLAQVSRITNNKIQTFDDIIVTIVEISFLYTKTKYKILIRGINDKDYIEKLKINALSEYVFNHPKLSNVPTILQPKLKEIRRVQSQRKSKLILSSNK